MMSGSKACNGDGKETAEDAIQSTSPSISTLEAAVTVPLPPKQGNGAAAGSSTAGGGRSQPVTRSLDEDLRVASELTPSAMTMPFHLRFYRKKRAVQLKPAEDAQVHFSLAWGDKKELSLHDMDDIRDQIVQHLEQVGTATSTSFWSATRIPRVVVTYLSALHHPMRAVGYAPRRVHAGWVLIGAWDPMLWPIWGFRLEAQFHARHRAWLLHLRPLRRGLREPAVCVAGQVPTLHEEEPGVGGPRGRAGA